MRGFWCGWRADLGGELGGKAGGDVGVGCEGDGWVSAGRKGAGDGRMEVWDVRDVQLVEDGLRLGFLLEERTAAAKIQDYYRILEVNYDATEETIRSNYIRLALKWHPDKKKGEENATSKFQEINEAYNVLSDPAKRREYDRKGVHVLDYNAMDLEMKKLIGTGHEFEGLSQSVQGPDIDMQRPRNQIFSMVIQ